MSPGLWTRNFTVHAHRTMAVSEIIRFVLPAHRRADFATLRASIARHGAVKSQYFGPSIATGGASLPVRGQEMCWVIRLSSLGLPLQFLRGTDSIFASRVATRHKATFFFTAVTVE